MSWGVVFSRSAEKDLRRLSPECGSEWGKPSGLWKMTPSEPPRNRSEDESNGAFESAIIVSSIPFDRDAKRLTIIAAGHRREVYRKD